MRKILLALSLAIPLTLSVQAQPTSRSSQSTVQSPFQPIQSGYGANGPFAIIDEKFSSPLYDSENVHVFRPAGDTVPVPVIFFAPGFANNDPDDYEPLINHIVSRG